MYFHPKDPKYATLCCLSPTLQAIEQKDTPLNTQEEMNLLKELLFDSTVSRNRQFERFEQQQTKRIHRLARILRNLRKELQEAGVEYWTEPAQNGRVCLQIYRPQVGSKRSVFLTQGQLDLLTHSHWEEKG